MKFKLLNFKEKNSYRDFLILISLSLLISIGTYIAITPNIPSVASKGSLPKMSPPYNPITIYTPQSTTYTAAMAGYYPGTYSFEDTADGYVPRDWVDCSTGSNEIAVVSSKAGHNKVLKLYDKFRLFDSKKAKAETTLDTPQAYGTVEFWFYTSTASLQHYITLRYDSSNRIALKLFAGSWQYEKGSSYVALPGMTEHLFMSSNKWYYIQIHFETRATGHYQGLSQYRFKLQVNDDISDQVAFKSDGEFNKLIFATSGWDTGYYVYIDAVGFATYDSSNTKYDQFYDHYDSRHEGIFLDFTPSGLDYMYFSLDGQSREIYGDTVFPMPKSGSHSIYVTGFDEYGFPYYSGVRQFSVDMIDKVAVILYASDANSNNGDPTYQWMAEGYIDEYTGKLYNGEGYRKFYIYRDVGSQTEFNNIIDCLVDKRIDYQDEIFFYIWGHGNYYSGNSHTCLDYKDYWRLSSSHYWNKLNYLYDETGSIKIGFLVESCYSGGFEEDFRGKYPFLAMTSSSTTRSSYIDGITREAVFSAYFWDEVSGGNNAYEAFFDAKTSTHIWNDWHFTPHQNPQISDNTPIDFMFFD